MRCQRGLTLVASLALLQGPAVVAQETWSRFRGPGGSGIAADMKPLPTRFGPDSQVVWKTELPFGRSSPVLTESEIYLTAQTGDQLTTFCLERDSGEVRWEESLQRTHEADMYAGNDSASSTPVTDGVNVYCFFHEFGLVSYDEEGEERWRQELGPFHSFYGVSASPVLAGNVVVMPCDQIGPSFVVGVHKDTGEELWRQDRRVAAESWATPIVRPVADDALEVLVFGTFQVDAYDAKTGQLHWQQKGLGFNPICSPVLHGNQLIVTASSHAEQPTPFATLLASDADGDGQLTKKELEGSPFDGHFGWIDPNQNGFAEKAEWDEIMKHSSTRDFGIVAVPLDAEAGPDGKRSESWRYKRNVASIGSPLVLDGVVYMIADGGILTLLDAQSGEVLARERIADSLGEVYPSPIAGDGKVFVAANAGTVSVLQAGRSFKLLASNDLGEDIRATPAISKGQLLVRTQSALYCFHGGADG
jgi:outer membrane protein assembly factor BamB